ncbi:MAG: 3-deoxy-7-phosphoheptulonate synthase [candidate division Zixibacteria bacterium CG_4_9_14_3_um_filter_46_8]|nr:MAG: 3-deoxy-7-phosphoheptulonate synthase [candidate division Zixibacteria bacterium CG_4_9_14_3_um_filter_46_8]
MIVVMSRKATSEQINDVLARIKSMGYRPHLSQGEERTIIGIIGNERKLDPDQFTIISGVENVIPILKPFKMASRDFKSEQSIIKVNGVHIGGNTIAVIAGPCAVESYEQTLKAAQAAKRYGATLLRGGAFKPRTSPYSFQGKGREGLEILAQVKKEVGLPIVTEVLAAEDVDMISEYADMLQLGARNMQNFALLERLGKCNRPILLKRGMMSTVEELLMSAEYILANGNPNVVLCERGIRTFETSTRNTPDLAAIPVVKKLSHLPVIFDPSHATGRRDLVIPMTAAALACGADGIIVEIHPWPDEALCDGPQSLTIELFAEMMEKVAKIAAAVGRST